MLEVGLGCVKEGRIHLLFEKYIHFCIAKDLVTQMCFPDLISGTTKNDGELPHLFPHSWASLGGGSGEGGPRGIWV